MVSCAIPSCKNASKNRQCSFFPFPKNPHYRAAWLAVSSKNIRKVNYARICSDHFLPGCFKPKSPNCEFVNRILNTESRQKRRLYPNVIPTENLHKSSSESNQNSKPDLVSTAEDSENNEYTDEQVSKTNDDVNNESTDEMLIETTDDIYVPEATEESLDSCDELHAIFSLMPKCTFTSAKEEKIYSDQLQLVKQNLIEKFQEDGLKLRKQKAESDKEIKRLRKEKAEWEKETRNLRKEKIEMEMEMIREKKKAMEMFLSQFHSLK